MEQFIFLDENRGRDTNNLITIVGDEHFHLARVLRVKPGEKILATDGAGTTCLCIVKKIGKSESVCEVVEEYHDMNSSLREFCIAMAVLKPASKLEFALEKCTELGARKFLLFDSERSGKVKLRTERLRGIITSAVKQSLQSRIPELAMIESLEELSSQSSAYNQKIVLHEKATIMMSEYLSDVPRTSPAIALVGPEGGFSEREIGFLESHGFKTLLLGKSRLRSETAAISIAAILNSY